MVKIVSSKENINNLKEIGEIDLANFYMSLKQISPNKFTKTLY